MAARLQAPLRARAGGCSHRRTPLRNKSRADRWEWRPTCYSIGIMLGELLTGVWPAGHRREPAATCDRGAAERRPVPPSAAAIDRATRRLLRGDLDAIVLKATHDHPDERYPTMDAMAEDIEHYLARLPVRALPHTVRYRMTKWISRNRLVFAAAAVAVAASLTGTAVAIRNLRVARTEKAYAEEVRDFLSALIRETSPYSAGGRAPSALEWLRHATDRIDHRLESRPEVRVELLNVVGSSMLTLQDTAGAEQVLSRAEEEGIRRLGLNHPQTLRARVLMTAVDRFRGRTAKMRARARVALADPACGRPKVRRGSGGRSQEPGPSRDGRGPLRCCGACR